MLKEQKILNILWMEILWKLIMNSQDENPHLHSEARKIKYLQQTLNSINAFSMSLVMSNVGSRFKLLRMSWYRSMKTFRTNLKLVVKKTIVS